MITLFDAHCVFVRYRNAYGSQATDRGDLDWCHPTSPQIHVIEVSASPFRSRSDDSMTERTENEPEWMPIALAISTVLHGKDNLQSLAWHQARGLAEELAKIVSDPQKIAELSRPEALMEAIERERRERLER